MCVCVSSLKRGSGIFIKSPPLEPTVFNIYQPVSKFSFPFNGLGVRHLLWLPLCFCVNSRSWALLIKPNMAENLVIEEPPISHSISLAGLAYSGFQQLNNTIFWDPGGHILCNSTWLLERSSPQDSNIPHPVIFWRALKTRHPAILQGQFMLPFFLSLFPIQVCFLCYLVCIFVLLF